MSEFGLPVPALAVVAFGGWSLVFWFVRLVFSGNLVTRKDHVAWMAHKDSIIESERAEKTMWRDVALTNGSQVGKLLETQTVTAEAFTKALDPQEKP